MLKKYKVNSKVQWKWMGCIIDGVVKEVYFESVIKIIKGKKIKRNGTPEKPAYLVQSVAGNLALKLHSELFVNSSVRRPQKEPDLKHQRLHFTLLKDDDE